MALATRAAVPPASSFAELLRRSRFATFDPNIAQTYTAPPAHARRGNYGLKRPIPMPYKDSYISLASFEHPAHFTEWNNAEAQVKSVKRVEEMNFFPRYATGSSSWRAGLGDAQTEWLVDSEFCEKSYTAEGRGRVVEEVIEHDEVASRPQSITDFSQYGKQGPGGYGSRRPLPKPPKGVEIQGNHPLPNPAAMPPKTFKRYLENLRELRPELQAFIAEEQREAALKKATQSQYELDPELPNEVEYDSSSIIDPDVTDLPEAQPDDFSLLIASNHHTKLHGKFLSKHSAKDYSSYESTKIEKQPHQNGGLLYSHPSLLDSVLNTPPQQGIVLQGMVYKDTKSKSTHKNLALFGGLVCDLHSLESDAKPIYDPDADDPLAASSAKKEQSIKMMRMIKLLVQWPPLVVSRRTARKPSKEVMRAIKLDVAAACDLPWSQRTWLLNAYRPGSYEYSTYTPPVANRYNMTHMSSSSVKDAASPSRFARLREKDAQNRAKRAAAATRVQAGNGNGKGRPGNATAAMLRRMAGLDNSANKGSEGS